ncbi:hypothetical protein GCM10010525_12440 [Glutamicibacter bergerei]|uniref:Uncharacterized protein n=1 Tax=Glutamicibacter ardleyensis TaxID=225894 RepID=A0ABQ2DM14_9MICC|nr:hypothetical protein GCM10007173_23210 [Glutamicibacter ardleyensis]
MQLKGCCVAKTLRDIPYHRVVSLVHLEEDASKLSTCQLNMLRQKFHNNCNFIDVVANQLSRQKDVVHKINPAMDYQHID